jgi:hypothetical protein
MMNPDQMYRLRQLQHHDLRAEAEQARAGRQLIGSRTAWSRLLTWPRSVGIYSARGATLQVTWSKALPPEPPE